MISRNSTFQYKGRAVEIAQIGSELGAGFVVEGSVRRAGDRLRVTAQLIESRTGTHLWAERYDRSIEDVFAVQDELTRTIAATLGARLYDAGLERTLAKNAADLDAYDCVLRARRFLAGPDEAAHADARDLLERAIALDPSYADAYAQLANIYLAEYRFEFNPRPDPLGRAMTMAQKAIELDPQNATAHCWLAIVHFFRRENERFVAESNRALALNPNDAETLANIGHYYAFMGEFDRGCELIEQAIALNPLHPGWYHFAFARRAYHAQDYRTVLAEIDRIDLPKFYWTWLLRIAALGQLGDRDNAAVAIEKL
ncbi:MAG: tetratricopeptide repeat protein [Alphaproteobacteria bacterium]